MSENYSENEQQGGGGGRHYIARPKFCQFCVDKNISINYKNIDTLTPFCNGRWKDSPTAPNRYMRQASTRSGW